MSSLTFLQCLSQQILKNQEGNWEIPWIKISKEEKGKCDQQRKIDCSNSTQTIVTIKYEIENPSITTFHSTTMTTMFEDNQSGPFFIAMCQMCSEITDCNTFFLKGSEYELMQEIFHTSDSELIKPSTELIFCEHCLQCIVKLRECYQNYKNARKIYQETLIRVQYFQKCAKQLQVTATESVLNTLCQMCLQITDCSTLSVSDSEQEHLQEIFHASELIETSSDLIFCEHCLQCIVKLRECYQNYKNSQTTYHETFLRAQNFQKCSEEVTVLETANDASYNSPSNADPDEEYEDVDHFEESCDYDDTTSIEIEPKPDNEIDESITTNSELESPKLKTNMRKCKRINRRGGLIDEDYKEHRRLQRQHRYLANKKKMDKRALGEDDPGEVESEYSEPVSALPSTSNDCINTTNDNDSSHSLENEGLVLEQEMGTEDESESCKSGLQPKKKQDYIRKTIRRRNGLTEEEYRKHRHEQKKKYSEWRKKTGTSAHETRLLRRPTVREKSERAEESVPLDSINLPAKSSLAPQVTVIQLDDVGKRFSYRNTEFSKQDDTYTCKKSDHLTKNPNVMKKHIAKLHFDKEHGYKCSYCEKSFYYRSQLRYHVISHTEKGHDVHCEECGKSFKHSSGYYVHRRIVHLGIKRKEPKKRLKKLADAPKDVRPTLKGKLEMAEEKIPLDSNNLPAKSSWGPQVTVVQLDDDGKRFSYRNTEFSKQDETTYTCQKCDHTTNNLNFMKMHISKNHFDKEQRYQCSYCEKSFYYRCQLRNHEINHTGEKVGIQCEECGKSFKHSSAYYLHRRIVHLGLKLHECQLCQKKFGTRGDLQKHTESISHRSKENANNGQL